MIAHSDLSGNTFGRSRELKRLIDTGEIKLAGNKNLRIYGLLNCSSGKRMKSVNRVFFKSEAEAMSLGYRPCGRCMRAAYLRWKGLA